MGIRERKEREKQIRRQQIREAAKELFVLKGFKSTTMEEIANKAELSAATIYQYFADKEHLTASVALEGIKPLLKQITKICEKHGLSVQDKLLGLKDSMYKAYESDPLFFRNVIQAQLMNDFGSINRDLLNETSSVFRKLLGSFADVYETGVRQGVFSDGHRMAYADIIFGTFIGIMILEVAKNKVNPQKNFFRSTLDRAFEIIIEGVKKT